MTPMFTGCGHGRHFGHSCSWSVDTSRGHG